jgi:alginate O-acetyltransferase complex protein AlgJ
MAVKADEAGVQRLESQVTLGVFLIALIFWCGASLVIDPGTLSRSENRYLAPAPTFDSQAGGLTAYVPALADYLADRVALRDAMISLHARTWVGLLGTSPTDKLIVGKDGWFFLNDAAAVGQYQGTAQLSEDELATWQRVLEQRRDWLAEQGSAFVLVLVPNKHQIYPEYMPDRLPRIAADEQHGQLARYLKVHSDLVVVDLMPTLLQAKEEQRVYHKTDTHWNDLGAYAGYEEILAASARALPQFASVIEPVAVKAEVSLEKGIGLTAMVGLKEIYREEVFKLVKLDPQAEILMKDKRLYAKFQNQQKPLALGVPSGGLPRAVVFRDSFSNALIPYLSENFRRVLFVWTRDVEAKYVLREKPDIVIQEIAGRLLDRTPRPIIDP